MTIPSIVGPRVVKNFGDGISAATNSAVDFVLRQSTMMAFLSGSSGQPTLAASFRENSTASVAIAHGESADPLDIMARWNKPKGECEWKKWRRDKREKVSDEDKTNGIHSLRKNRTEKWKEKGGRKNAWDRWRMKGCGKTSIIANLHPKRICWRRRKKKHAKRRIDSRANVVCWVRKGVRNGRRQERAVKAVSPSVRANQSETME